MIQRLMNMLGVSAQTEVQPERVECVASSLCEMGYVLAECRTNGDCVVYGDMITCC